MTGRTFPRGKYMWVAFYHHGKEQRECARHVRTDAKIEASDPKAQHEAERYLKARLDQITAEKHGGPAFIGTTEKRTTVNDLLDSLESDYKTRGKDSAQFKSHLKRIRSISVRGRPSKLARTPSLTTSKRCGRTITRTPLSTAALSF